MSYLAIPLGLPPGGAAGQVPRKKTDGTVEWGDPPAVDLPAGAAGQLLGWNAAAGAWAPVDAPTPAAVVTAPAGEVLLGMWAPGFPTVSTVQAHEQTTGARYSIVSAFRGATGGDWLHDTVTNAAARAGYTVLIAWDMGSTSGWNLSSWATGAHDAYIDQVIQGAKAAPDVTVYVRPWAEFNADFQPYQPGGTGAAAGTPAQFLAAWKHLVDRVRGAGVSNVRFVWCPTTDTYAQTTQDLSTVWPGAGYVDVIGLDGYNWGTSAAGASPALAWTSFEDVYREQYARVTALDPSLPVWVCEVGSKEPASSDGAPADTGHSKAQWITDMHAVLPARFPRVRALVWFSEQKERDWRVDSSPAALHAWQAANGVSAVTTTTGGSGGTGALSYSTDTEGYVVLDSTDPNAYATDADGYVTIN